MSIFEHSSDIGHEIPKAPATNKWDKLPDSANIGQGTQKNSVGIIPYATLKDAQLNVYNGTYKSITLGRQSDGSYGMRFSDGSNVRLLIGPDSTGNEVVKISKPGYDAPTATAQQLIFNSAQDAFKIAFSTTVTGSSITAGTSSSIVVPHGLGVTPIPLAFFAGGAFYYPLPFAPNQSYGGSITGVVNLTWCYCSADSTNIYITQINGDVVTRGPYTFKVYALQETAN